MGRTVEQLKQNIENAKAAGVSLNNIVSQMSDEDRTTYYGKIKTARTVEQLRQNIASFLGVGVPLSTIITGMSPEERTIYYSKIKTQNKRLRGPNTAKVVSASSGPLIDPKLTDYNKLVNEMLSKSKTIPMVDLVLSLTKDQQTIMSKTIINMFPEKKWPGWIQTHVPHILPTGTSASSTTTSASTTSSTTTSSSTTTTSSAQQQTGLVGFCPLVNIRNNCYQNASMQLLYSVPEIRAYFSVDHFADIDGDKISHCGGETVANLQKILHLMNIFVMEMSKPRVSALDVRTIKHPGIITTNLYSDFLSMLNFRPGEQNDAMEYVRQLLDRLFCSPLLANIKDAFTFIVKQQLFCQDPSITPAPLSYESQVVGLPIDNAGVTDIQTGVVAYQSKNADVASKVVACNGGKQTHKEYTIEIQPKQKYVLFELSRIGYDLTATGEIQYVTDQIDPTTGTYKSVIDPRTIPAGYRITDTKRKKNSKNIKLNPEITLQDASGVPFKFKLKMAIVHAGGAYGGHYIAYNFKSDGSPDMIFNDSIVQSATIGTEYYARDKDFINKNALAILYERVRTPGGYRTRKHKKASKRRHTRKH